MSSHNAHARSSTKEWIESLTSSLLPGHDKDEADISSVTKNEPDWWYNMSLNLYGPQSLPVCKGSKYLRKDVSVENIEPYMHPMKNVAKILANRYKEAEKKKQEKSKKEGKISIFKPNQPKKETKNECEKTMWTCTCDEVPNLRGVLPLNKKTPPPFEPCVCYQTERLLKAMHPDSELDLPSICSPSEEFTTARFIVEELPEYSVISYGRGLIPSPEPIDTLDPPSLIVHSFLLTGENGFQVEVSQLGARVVAIRAPDAEGKVDDVILGFDRPKGYLKNGDKHWGGIVGRVADRVRGPRPQVYIPGNGHTLLTENDKRDYNMGGENSYDREVWEAHVQPSGVLFTLLSRAGSDGFPGHLLLSVLYCVMPMNRLVVQTAAQTSAPTPLALSLPLPFNLAGHGSGESELFEHVLTCSADKYHASKLVDGKTIYTGHMKLLGGTPYDLRIPRQLGKVMKFTPDNCYDLLLAPTEYKPDDEPRRVAKLIHPKSRRFLEVWTDYPALRVSTELGLPDSAPHLPDVHALSDSRAVLEQIVRDVPLQSWLLFDWLKRVDSAGERDELYHPQERPVKEKKDSDGKELPDKDKSRPRWRDRQHGGAGDQRPSHPGLNALPMPLRGPAKHPFDPKTMRILHAGGLQSAPRNPVGRVIPDQRYKEPDFDPRGFNLKPSNVGSIPRKSSSKSLRYSDTRRSTVTAPTDDLGSYRGSLDFLRAPENTIGSVCPSSSMPNFLTDDDRKYVINKTMPPSHRPSVWGKANPSTWGTERLRAGADLFDLLGLGDAISPEQTSPRSPAQLSPSLEPEPDQWQGNDQQSPPIQETNQYPDYQSPTGSYQEPLGYQDPSQYSPQNYDQPYPQYPQESQYPYYPEYPQSQYPQYPQESPYSQYPQDSPYPQYPQYPQEPPYSQYPQYPQYPPYPQYPEYPQYPDQSQYPPDSVWPRDQYPDMWPSPQYDTQWPGVHFDDQSFPGRAPPHHPNNPLQQDRFYKPHPYPHIALRPSGLGSIAYNLGISGAQPNMVGTVRPSGLGSILSKNVPGRPPFYIGVDPNLIPAQIHSEPVSPTDLPTPEFEISDKLKKKLLSMRRPPNPGYEVRMPMKPKIEETKEVLGDIMDDILKQVYTPPRKFRGFNGVNYEKNAGIMLQPQMDPLNENKLNIDTMMLRPGKLYQHTIIYAFGVVEKKPRPKKHRKMGEAKVEVEKEETMLDHCSVEVSQASESSSSFLKLHDSCSEKSQSSKMSA